MKGLSRILNKSKKKQREKEMNRYRRLLKIAEALEEFKHKVYARYLNKNKEDDDWIMSNAPCNYNLQDYEVVETCMCGGIAKVIREENGIPILKCEKCGDEFESHEEYWE
jgi:hypothetical protein